MPSPLVSVVDRPEWLKPSNAYGWSALLRNVLLLLALLSLAPLLADRHLLAAWLLAPAIGLAIYRLTVVMHDCTHRTLFVSRQLNERIGLLLSALTGVDFQSFSNQHWRHHRSYGQSEDPQGFHYVGLGAMTSAEFRWHLLKPLLGFNMRYAFAESLLAPKNLARIISTGEIAVVAIVQFALLSLVTGFWRHILLAVLPFVAAATFGLFLSQLRGIAEHGVVKEIEMGQVRSHSPNLIDRTLLYDMNFNFHKEHHAHPDIPSCRLPLVQRSASERISNLPRSMFATLRAIDASLRHSRG